MTDEEIKQAKEGWARALDEIERLKKLIGKPALDTEAEVIMGRRVNAALRDQIQDLFSENDQLRARVAELEAALAKWGIKGEVT